MIRPLKIRWILTCAAAVFLLAVTPASAQDYEATRHAAEPSVDGSNPAICGHRKSGHFRRPETAPEFYFKGSCTRKDV